MNPYVVLGAVVVWGATAAGAFWYGTDVGRDGEIAKQAAIEQAIRDTRQAALEGAADAISKIKVTNTTVQGKTETIVRERTVYSNCVHDPDLMRIINEALTGRTEPPGDRKLPGVNAVN